MILLRRQPYYSGGSLEFPLFALKRGQCLSRDGIPILKYIERWGQPETKGLSPENLSCICCKILESKIKNELVGFIEGSKEKFNLADRALQMSSGWLILPRTDLKRTIAGQNRFWTG